VDKPRGGNRVTWFFKSLARELVADNITDVGAMMAYYAILSLFPMIVFIITLGLLVLDSSTIQQGVQMVTATLPPAVSQLISEQIAKLIATAHAGFAIGSVAFALWGASRSELPVGVKPTLLARSRSTRSRRRPSRSKATTSSSSSRRRASASRSTRPARSRPEKAPPLYARALELKPAYAPALQALAEIAMEQGDHRRAADLLTRQATATEAPDERMRLFEALGDMAPTAGRRPDR